MLNCAHNKFPIIITYPVHGVFLFGESVAMQYTCATHAVVCGVEEHAIKLVRIEMTIGRLVRGFVAKRRQ